MSLADAEKAATMERGAFVSLEARFRKARHELFGSDPEGTVVNSKQSPAALLPKFLRRSRTSSPGLAPWWKVRLAYSLPRP